MQRTLTEGVGRQPAGAKTSAFLYRVLDADQPAGPSARWSLDDVDEVVLGRGEAHRAERRTTDGKRTLQLGVHDRWMSSQHARLTRVMSAWVLEDTRSKNGVRRRGEPVQRTELADGDVFELGRTFFVFRAAQPLAGDVTSEALRPPAPGLATLSPDLAEKLAALAKFAASGVSLALSGPSGSGKEIVAKALHALSGRRGAFVAVNCGALPDELVESELFGHKKGAFSGALEDRPGLIRAAHEGTLLLDEVGDLPLEAQPALLRVLQEKAVTPVGSTKPLPVDVRVISATHRALERRCEQGLFRDDLRARLTGFRAELPGLAERREDLGLLVGALLQRLAPSRASSVQLTLEAARALFDYAWPLNVRELEKALEAGIVLAGTAALDVAHLPPEVRTRAPKRTPDAPDAEDAARKAELEALLRQHGGNVSAVARAMGKARMQIQRWLARYGLDPRDFKAP